MDILGTKKLVGIIEQATGAVIPQTGEALAELTNQLDAAGVFMGEATELVQQLQEVAEDVPEEWRRLVKAGLGLVDHMVRVGTRASNTLRDAEQTSRQARELLSAMHDRGLMVSIREE